MKKILSIIIIATCFISAGFYSGAYSQEINKEDCFFLSSLHYTSRGMAYWYDRANGGLEILTGIPYSKLGCKNCHIKSCDECHKTEADGKATYSTKAARNQKVCLNCHKREALIKKIDKSANQEDVHFAKGMQCTECHTAREMHGDGVEYKSMKQQGVMDTKCEKCHESIKQSVSHKIHDEKLECKSCHVRHVVSCTNCHFDSLVKKGERAAIKVSGWTFLMNYNGKVTAANMQTFVVNGNKTFLMFAPQFSHSIMKDGRKCNACHATEIVDQIKNGEINLTWLKNEKIENIKGIIPVIDGSEYNCFYQNYSDGKWIPITDPHEPIIHYAGFGEPLSKEQLNSLTKSMDKIMKVLK
ncbi:MAG: hypothetical protein SV062_05020 [Thermodesulfobacteriota bacterium]|nr:hypothetical protein [Thermodesulfobacteriota bacterium]